MRLITEHIAPGAGGNSDDPSLANLNVEDDKTMAMMGLTKTIEAVSSRNTPFASILTSPQVIDALETVEPKPVEVVAHVQEIVLPIIKFTLENKVIGQSPGAHLSIPFAHMPLIFTDLFDSVFSLVDIFTFTLRKIAPSMWVIYENMYKLFKTDAADYLEGTF